MKAPRVTWNKRDQVWFFKYQPLEGSRKSKNVPASIAGSENEREKAQHWADDYMTALARNGGKPPTWDVKLSAEKVTILGTYDKWLAHRENHPKTGRNTFKGLKSSIKNNVLPDEIARRPIDEIDAHDCYAWVERMVKGKAPNSARNHYSALLTFFDDCYAKRWATLPKGNPLAHKFVKDALPEAVNLVGKKDVIHLTREQVLTLVHAERQVMPPMRRLRHLFVLTQGTREGETQGLSIGNVRLDGEIAFVEIDRQLDEEKNFVGCKKDSERTLPLHPLTEAGLRWWIEVGWRQWVGRKPKPSDPLFPDFHGEYCRPKSALHLRTDLSNAKLPTHYKGLFINGHALRRTFATMLADAGVDEQIRGILMGHDASTVTDKHYTARHLPRFKPAIYALNLGDPLDWDALGARQSVVTNKFDKILGREKPLTIGPDAGASETSMNALLDNSIPAAPTEQPDSSRLPTLDVHEAIPYVPCYPYFDRTVSALDEVNPGQFWPPFGVFRSDFVKWRNRPLPSKQKVILALQHTDEDGAEFSKTTHFAWVGWVGSNNPQVTSEAVLPMSADCYEESADEGQQGSARVSKDNKRVSDTSARVSKGQQGSRGMPSNPVPEAIQPTPTLALDPSNPEHVAAVKAYLVALSATSQTG